MGEGIPLTPLEAMACQVPILVGSEDGSIEAVSEGINGFIIDPKNESQLVQCLMNILTDQELHQRLVEGTGLVANSFSYESFLEKHRDFYTECGAIRL